MAAVLIPLYLITLILSLAVFSNILRRNKHYAGALVPNCLLTRHPLLFITGPRSIFYYSSYWNLYTSFLAEHGYEVYTLRLPWRSRSARSYRLKDFILQQEKIGKSFHFVMDQSTKDEFQDLLRQLNSPTVRSILSIHDQKNSALKDNNKTNLYPLPCSSKELHFKIAQPSSILHNLSSILHRLIIGRSHFLNLSSLGAQSSLLMQNCQELLRVCQELAEEDFIGH